MNLKTFNDLTLAEKYDVICSWGFFMIRNRAGNTTTALFSIHDFFAEIVISRTDCNLTSVMSYTNETLPLSYYQKINFESPFLSGNVPTSEVIQSLLAA
jgi:hypothetical protein